MKSVNLFLATMITTAALSYSNICLTADEKNAAAEQTIAKSKGTAIVNNCEVSGRLVRENGNVYAVLTALNTTDKDTELDIHYAVTSQLEAMKYSRMASFPSEVKRDQWAVALKAKSTKTEKVLILAAPEPRAEVPTKKVVKVDLPVEWTLAISPTALGKGVSFSMAGVATPTQEKVKLGKGIFVLARTEFGNKKNPDALAGKTSAVKESGQNS